MPTATAVTPPDTAMSVGVSLADAPYTFSRQCCHYLIGLAVLATVGLAVATWLHMLAYVAVFTVLLLIGTAGAAGIYSYAATYSDVFRFTARQTRTATQLAARQAKAVDAEAKRKIAEAARVAEVAAQAAVRKAADEAANAGRLARTPREIKIDDARQADGEGFLYIVQFSSGAIKVGQTIHLKQRLAKHRRDAAAYDVVLVDGWVSPPHGDYLHNERVLISLCCLYGARAKNEYFHGMDLAQAVRLASHLTYLPAAVIASGVDQ